MKNMKKVLAVLAASAVSVSMFAFAGCGDDKNNNNTPSGAIEGNYEEKTPDEMGGIIDDFFGSKDDGAGDNTGDNTETPEAVSGGIGIKINLSESAYVEGIFDMSSSIKADFKEKITETGFVGAGTATVKANVKAMDFTQAGAPVSNEMTDKVSIDVSGTAYNDSTYIYGGASGSFGMVNENTGLYETKTIPEGTKAKLNLETLMEVFEGMVGEGNKNPSLPAAVAEDNSGNQEPVSIMSTLLQLANDYSVKVGVDVSDGMKIKISATQETIWKVVAAALIEAGAPETEVAETVEQFKSFVTVNKFLFDVYAQFDSNKQLVAASVVTDIDVKVNMAILSAFAPSSPAPTAAANEVQIPDIAVKLSGSVEMYSHNDDVVIPENIASDTSYADKTDDLIALISQAM